MYTSNICFIFQRTTYGVDCYRCKQFICNVVNYTTYILFCFISTDLASVNQGGIKCKLESFIHSTPLLLVVSLFQSYGPQFALKNYCFSWTNNLINGQLSNSAHFYPEHLLMVWSNLTLIQSTIKLWSRITGSLVVLGDEQEWTHTHTHTVYDEVVCKTDLNSFQNKICGYNRRDNIITRETMLPICADRPNQRIQCNVEWTDWPCEWHGIKPRNVLFCDASKFAIMCNLICIHRHFAYITKKSEATAVAISICTRCKCCHVAPA